MTESAAEQRAPRAAWLTLLLLVAAIYFYIPNNQGVFLTPNELSRIFLTQAIVEDGSFRIDRAVEAYGESIDMARYEGHYYSDKAPGVAFLSVPVYFLFQTLGKGAFDEKELIPICRFFVVTLPALVFIAFVLRRWTGLGALGRILVVGLAVGTTFYPYSITFYGHVPLAILVSWIYWRLAETPPEEAAGPLHLAWTGFLCGLAVLVDFTGGVFVVFAGLYLLWKKRSPVPLLWLAAGAAPVLSLLLVYNYQCFGDPFDLAYNHMIMEEDRINRTTGFFGIGLPDPEAVWGLTLGLERGLFIYSPFLLLLVPAFKSLGRPWRWQARDVLAASTIGAYFWLNASLIDWPGGWTLGPRYLIPIYPLALTLILRAAANESAEVRRRYLVFGAGAVTWSGLFHLAGAGSWLHTPEPMRFPVPEIATYLFVRGLAQPNVGLDLGLPGAWSLAPVVLIFAAALALSLKVDSRSSTRLGWVRPSLAAAFGAAFLVAVFSLAYLTMGEKQIRKAKYFASVVGHSPTAARRMPE